MFLRLLACCWSFTLRLIWPQSCCHAWLCRCLNSKWSHLWIKNSIRLAGCFFLVSKALILCNIIILRHLILEPLLPVSWLLRYFEVSIELIHRRLANWSFVVDNAVFFVNNPWVETLSLVGMVYTLSTHGSSNGAQHWDRTWWVCKILIERCWH